MRTTLLARAPVLALSLVLVAGPAGAQDATPSDSTSSVLDDDGVVVSTSAIADLELRLAELVAELDDIADGETHAQAAAAVARDRLEAADRAVGRTASAAEEARVELTRAETRFREVEERLAAARRDRDDAADDLAATEQLLEESRALLQGRLRAAWMHGGQLTSTSMVLGMEDFNDVARVQQLLRDVVEDDNELVADYLRLQLQRTERLAASTAEQERVATATDNAADSRAARATAAEDATAAAEDARATQQERTDVLAEVRADLRHLGISRLAVEEEIDQVTAARAAAVELELERRREEAERERLQEAERQRLKEAERERLDEEQRRADALRRASAQLTEAETRAADLRAEHQRRIAQAAAGDTAATGVALPARGCGSTSAWVWPTTGCVTSAFGYRTHPVLGTRRLHAGLDIPASSGTPILAVADGTVHRAGWSSGGHGNVVVIDHGEVATLYAHQVRVNVRTGQRVVAGQVIGWVGSTGLSTGPHLHVETHLDGPYGTSVDPARWFR